MEIDKIKVVSNIRHDMGDMSELAASIKERGVLVPLHINKKNELIAGHRRLVAAKAAGLKDVPVIVVDEDKDTQREIQFLENIQRQNMSPVEEGDAFSKYIKETKHDMEYLAKKIHKPADYVQRRVIISGLPIEARKALEENKIHLGHALLLAKIEASKTKDLLKKIINDKLSVAAAIDTAQYSGTTRSLSNASFNKKQCQDCKFNGSVQGQLFETGKSLNGLCTNTSCYTKKTQELVNDLKKKHSGHMFNIKNEWESPAGFCEADGWNEKEHGITPAYKKKCRQDKDPANYLVKVKSNGEIVEYFKVQKSESKKASGKKSVDKLSEKIAEYKDHFLRDQILAQIKPCRQVHNVILCDLEQQNSLMPSGKQLDAYDKLTDKQLLEKYTDHAKEIIGYPNLREEQLGRFAAMFGVSLAKDFKLTEGFLSMYTKTQLLSLAKQFSMTVPNGKNQVIIKAMVTQWKPGQVPKELKGDS